MALNVGLNDDQDASGVAKKVSRGADVGVAKEEVGVAN